MGSGGQRWEHSGRPSGAVALGRGYSPAAVADASETDRPTVGAPLVIAGERGSGRSAAAMAAAAGGGRGLRVVHGLETRRGPACWAPVLGEEPTATPDARALAERLGECVLVVDDADLLAPPDRAVLHELAQHVAVVVVVAAPAAADFAIDLACVPMWTAWPEHVADHEAVLGESTSDDRAWAATWAALADALAIATVPTELVGSVPERLIGSRRAVVTDDRVAVWPAFGRLVAGAPDVLPATELLRALAGRLTDEALASDLLHAAGDVAGAGAAARRALVGSVSADRRARLLMRVADIGTDDDLERACEALVRRELAHEHPHLLERLSTRPDGAAHSRVAVLRQLDREHDRWVEWIAPTDRGAPGPERERLTLVGQGHVEIGQLGVSQDELADLPDLDSCDDLDHLRLRWSLSVLASARNVDTAGMEQAEAIARRFGPFRAAWNRTADDLGAIVAFHRCGDLDATAGLLDGGGTPRVPLALRQAHRVLALADGGRTTDAIALLDTVLDGPSITTRALRRWCRIEVELAAGRVVTALRVAQESPPRPGEPIDLLGLVAHAWAAHDAGETLPDDTVGTGWPALQPASLELEALRRWRIDGPGATVTERFTVAADAWSGRHLRGELRCRWAAAEVARLAGGSDEPVRMLRELDRQALATGSLPLLARVRQSLRRAGVRSSSPRPVASQAGGPLSPREREVLLMAGKGLTARAIAQQLGVGVATVETQITSAMVKLGARTRVQAALMIAEGPA